MYNIANLQDTATPTPIRLLQFYRWINSQIKEYEYQLLDEYLIQFDPSIVELNFTLGLLNQTYSVSNKLVNWAVLLRHVREYLISIGLDDKQYLKEYSHPLRNRM